MKNVRTFLYNYLEIMYLQERKCKNQERRRKDKGLKIEQKERNRKKNVRKNKNEI